ncbi:NAD-dependent epimerase/dehydratase family protein [Candidatus Micrarchaeota archaeon]|nr:NAD-dependent epimerase/dehydratase family protein [Candidatus Micrarchaeota archaeon]
MKIISTGAAGFIGSNLTKRLVNEGHQVLAVDNMHTGSEENLKGIDVELMKCDSGEVEKWGSFEPEAIFHNGIYSSSPMYVQNPYLTSKVIDEFLHILEYARKNDAKVVYASSSSVYNSIKPPHKEEMVPLVKDFYTEARYPMDRLGILYNEFYGIQVTGLRYFSVYGPNEKSKGKYANLISQFLWAIKKGEKPVVYGDGNQTRDFTYVDDVVEANILSMDKGISGVFNVGTGKYITINNMIKLLNEKMGTNLEPEYVENPIKNYVYETQADVEKAREVLGFEAKVKLEEGIEKLVEHYRDE